MVTTFKYGETNFGIQVPRGRYRARFLGTEDREPFQGESRYPNKDTGPRMAWVFEVVEGEHKGKKIVPETGCVASPRSKCAAVIRGLIGGPVAIGQQVNVEQYVGRLYVLKIDVNPDSDKGNLHVADMEPEGATSGGSATASSQPAGPLPKGPPKAPPRTNTAAPPPRTNTAAPPPADARRWWVAVPNAPDDAEPVEMDRSGVQKLIDDSKTAPADLGLCLTTGDEWKTAADYGFGAPSPIPW